MVKIELECDEEDALVIHHAIAIRQTWNRPDPLPDGGGNLAGRVIAEICRGWLEGLEE